METPVSSFPALQLDELVKVVPGLAQVLYAALVAPAADILDHVALKVAQRVSGNVVPRLDDFVFVVDSCHLLGVGSHWVGPLVQKAWYGCSKTLPQALSEPGVFI